MKDPEQQNWTRPADLRAQVMRRWTRGDLLDPQRTAETPFPWRLPLKGPRSGDLAGHFDAVRSWIAEWNGATGLRLEWRIAASRVLGSNSLPAAAWLETVEEAIALIGKRREWQRFQGLLEITRQRQPELEAWIVRRPLQALEHADDWERLLEIVAWRRASPLSAIYLRQIDVPGVHSKFVESRRQVLAELFDLILPPESMDRTATGGGGFNRRYGFRDKPERIRFRFLDASAAIAPERLGLDLTVDASHFATLRPGVARVFITENEINYLAFPDVPDALLIFGAGYGFHLLDRAGWLRDCRVQYWGDIDTHGFAILDQLRAHLPHAESLLMDRETLFAFQESWGIEETPTKRDLPRLTTAEAALYDDLRDQRLGQKLRLEQERISLQWLADRLDRAGNP